MFRRNVAAAGAKKKKKTVGASRRQGLLSRIGRKAQEPIFVASDSSDDEQYDDQNGVQNENDDDIVPPAAKKARAPSSPFSIATVATSLSSNSPPKRTLRESNASIVSRTSTVRRTAKRTARKSVSSSHVPNSRPVVRAPAHSVSSSTKPGARAPSPMQSSSEEEILPTKGSSTRNSAARQQHTRALRDNSSSEEEEWQQMPPHTKARSSRDDEESRSAPRKKLAPRASPRKQHARQSRRDPCEEKQPGGPPPSRKREWDDTERRSETVRKRERVAPAAATVQQDPPPPAAATIPKKKKHVQEKLLTTEAAPRSATTSPATPVSIKKRVRPQRASRTPKEAEARRPSTPTPVLGEDEPATPDVLESHCWRCKCRVKEIDGKPSLYALHVHPLLHVPCCSVCCEIVAAIETTDDQDEVDVCSVCGDGGDALLLCDWCPRAFCHVCTAQAWGGGTKGLNQVHRLTQDEEKGWACLMCSPTAVLKRLQIQDTVGNDDDDGEKGATNEATVEQVVENLTKLEDELQHYQTMVLTEDSMQRVEKEVRQELATRGTTKAVLEQQVDEEMSLFQEKQQWHYDLLQDQKVDLLEHLNAFGISDDMYYKYYYENSDKASEEGDDEEWKRQADAFNEKREMEEQKAVRKTQDESSDDDESDREQEALEEVEDLCNSSQPEEWETEDVVNNRFLWKTDHRSREWFDKKLTKYMDNDDEMLKRAKSRFTKVDTASDENQIRAEFIRSSATSNTNGGVTIRRDEIVHTLNVRKKVKIAPAVGKAKDSQRRANTLLSNPELGTLSQSTQEARSSSLRSTPLKTPAKGNNMQGSSSGQTSTSAKRGPADGSDLDYDIDDDDVPKLKPFVGDTFWDSCTELSTEQDGARTIRIAAALASQLKPHQIEGVKFLWQNSCKDLSTITRKEQVKEESKVGGCILAHMMGLGKSLQVVTLVHTVLNHPHLRPPGDNAANQFIHTILLIVPVNTIANWNNEFDLWTGKLEQSVRVFDISEVRKEARLKVVRTWSQRGGVLLIGSDLYASLIKNNKGLSEHFQNPGPDMVVIDEAHTLLKKEASQISKRLGPIRTKRRIILSGTPFVNNLSEYYQLADWVRPGVFGAPSQFERKYVKPITAGLASDSSIQAVALQVQRSQQLFAEIAPFMQRRDISILKQELPPCQTAVLYIRQTKLQTTLYRQFDRFAKKLKSEGEELPFITQYQTLRPLHNHPYCLLQSARGMAKRDSIKKDKEKKAEAAASCIKMEAINQTLRDQSSNTNQEDAVVDLLDSESDEGLPSSGRTSPVEPVNENGKPTAETKRASKAKAKRGKKSTDFSWMESTVAKVGGSRMESVACGNKMFLLLQILANAQAVGDKVVVFSQCLKTLDFIEQILKKDWASFCEGYEKDRDLGNWRKGVDYLRIDGSVNSSERGELVSSFHAEYESHKLFLLSIEAGGIGINLVAANRVILFDNHWNPTVSSQAFHRCYRYGQVKPVYGYRFITEGSMEEKIFSRSMNKSGIAARVIDLKFPERNFSKRELAEIKTTDSWAQCDKCNKWRMIFFKSEEELEDKWYCPTNNDPFNNTCTRPERGQQWYDKHRLRIMNSIDVDVDEKFVGRESLDAGSDDKSDAAKEALIKKDGILMSMGLLKLFEANKDEESRSTRDTTANKISKIEFQEMLQTESADLEIEASHREAEAAAEALAKEAAAAAAKDAEALAQEASIREAAAAKSPDANAIETSRREDAVQVPMHAAAKSPEANAIETSRREDAVQVPMHAEVEASLQEESVSAGSCQEMPLPKHPYEEFRKEQGYKQSEKKKSEEELVGASTSIFAEKADGGPYTGPGDTVALPETSKSAKPNTVLSGSSSNTSSLSETNYAKVNKNDANQAPRNTSEIDSAKKRGSIDQPIDLLDSDSE